MSTNQRLRNKDQKIWELVIDQQNKSKLIHY